MRSYRDYLDRQGVAPGPWVGAPPASQDRAGAPSGSSPVPGLEQSRSSTGAALVALAERCETAEGPDRTLDGDIHEALFGAKRGHELGFAASVANDRFYTDPETGYGLPAPINFTWAVEGAEQALPGPEWPEWQITRRFCTGYHASVGMGDDGVGCETPALALCAAALRTRAASVDTHPQDGDAVAAPFMSGAVPREVAADAQPLDTSEQPQ